MNLQQFVDTYNLKWVKNGGLSQCVALCRQYFDDVLHIPQFSQIAGAYQIYDIVSDNDFTKVLNTPTGVPPRGAIIIWKKEYGGVGHVGIVLEADVNGILVFSQNHTGNLDPCEVTSYSYNLVKGWLVPKGGFMTYDLFRTPDGAIYERLNNYALVHIPDPEFLKRYYGDSPKITEVGDIWSVGWIAEDPRPLKERLTACENRPPQIVEKEVIKEVDRPETLKELKTAQDDLVEANKALEASIKDTDVCLKSKAELFAELDNVFDKNFVIPRNIISNLIADIKDWLKGKK